MSTKWEPDLASQDVEEDMEAKDVPESDRDELRKFSEFLRVKKPQGVTPQMREWALGNDTEEQA